MAFEALKACLISAPILGFPTEDGRFLLDTDASLFAVGGVLNQIQWDREVVIAYASRSPRLSHRRYCTTRREMLAALVMCTHFRSYLQGAQFTLRADHSYLRWLQKFRNGDGMLARWYMLLGQFSVTLSIVWGLSMQMNREFENKVMQELCLLCGAHKTRTTPYHPESDGLVERYNITLLMMLAMFAGENRDDWDDLLPAVMMAYRSSVHESTGYSLYRLMFGE